MAVVKGIDELNALVGDRLNGVPAGVVAATQGILAATSEVDLEIAGDLYREALEQVLGGAGGVETFLSEVVTDTLSFLPPLAQAAKAAIAVARARGQDLQLDTKLGPAEVGASAPAVFARPDPMPAR